MAAAALAMAFHSHRIERRFGIFLSLCLLSIPTTLLAFAPNLGVFAALRVTQGLFMATAFSLTLAYLGERCSDTDFRRRLRRLHHRQRREQPRRPVHRGRGRERRRPRSEFLCVRPPQSSGRGARLFNVDKVPRMKPATIVEAAPMAAWLEHCRNPRLRADFGIGFCILFAFIGTFTYVNFVLTRPPLVVV